MPFRPRQEPSLHNVLRFERFQPRATRWESLKSSFYNTRERTMLGGIYNRLVAPSMDEGPMLSPERANEIYPEIEEPFVRPVSRDFAHFVASRQRQKHALDMVVAAGPQDTLQTILNFGAAMGASMIDPVEIGVTSIGAGLIFKGLRSANLLQNATRRTELARAAMVNLAGASMVEPFLYRDARYFQETRTLEEAFTSVAASAIMGTFLDYSIGRIFSGPNPEAEISKALALSNLGKRYDSESFNSNLPAVKGYSNDITVREMPIAGQRRIGFDGDFGPNPNNPRGPEPSPQGGPQKRPDGKVNINEFRYDYAPMSDGPSFKRFYTVTSSSRGKIQGGRTPLMSLLLDEGLQFSDNPRRAALFTDTDMNTNTSIGSLREVRINEGNFIDADVPYQNLSRSVRKLLDSLGQGRDDVSLADALRSVKLRDASKIEANLRRIMEEEGIDGFYFTENQGGDRSNSLYLKDSSKFTEQKSYEVFKESPRAQKNKNQDIAEYMASERSDFYYSKEDTARYDDLSTEFKEEFDLAVPEGVTETRAEFDSLASRKDTPIEVKRAVEEAQMMQDELDSMPEILKSAFFCGKG